MDAHSSLEPAEPRDTPALSVVLGFGPMLPFVAAAVAAWLIGDAALPALLGATLIWGGALLCFLSGVRRGLSFRTAGGARVSQLAAMLWLFVLGVGALLSPWPFTSLALLVIGFASIIVLDPWAARHGEAPPFFAKMRPLQMAIPVLCLLVLALQLARSAG